MTAADHVVGARLLRRLLVGGTISSVVVGPVLRVLVGGDLPGAAEIEGQTYLDLIGVWAVLPASSRIPELAELPDMPTDVQIRTLSELRGERITAVQLGDPHPNLTLLLSSGKVLFINGHDQQYECWQVGVFGGQRGELWQIIAGPEDELSIWAPESFLRIDH